MGRQGAETEMPAVTFGHTGAPATHRQYHFFFVFFSLQVLLFFSGASGPSADGRARCFYETRAFKHSQK